MKINVAQLLKGSLGDRREYDIDDITAEGYPVRGEVALVRTNRSILVTGKFDTVVRNACSRCLEEFDYPLKFEVEEEFFSSRDISTDEPISPESDSEGFDIGENHILDLSEAVRQSIVLNLPVKPVCQPDCAGLCQQCGSNLNIGPCHCSKEPMDPRWSALREMLSK